MSFTPLFGAHYKDFLSIFQKLNDFFHGLDIDKISKHYLNNTNINNATQVRRKIYEFVGDLAIKCPTYHFAKRFSQYTSPQTNVLFYLLTHSAYPGRYGYDFGVHHGSELELVFGHPLLFRKSNSNENIEFSKEVMKLFTDFAKTGLISKQMSIELQF